MTAFNPSTAYANDSQWMDFVDDATLEKPNATETPEKIDGLSVRRGSIDTTDFAALAAGLAFSSSAAAFVVWPPVDPDADEQVELGLYQGCILRLTETQQGWMVQAHEKTRFGHYLMVCEKEVVNAAT